MDNTNTTQAQLSNIYAQFANNITETRHDSELAAMHNLSQQGLSLALNGAPLTPLADNFIRAAVFFNPNLLPRITKTLGDFVANTGDDSFVQLLQSFSEKYQLKQGQIIETSTSVVQKTREPH